MNSAEPLIFPPACLESHAIEKNHSRAPCRGKQGAEETLGSQELVPLEGRKAASYLYYLYI